MDQDTAHNEPTPESTPNTPVSTSTTPTETTVDNNLIMGILCYLGILLIIPYLMAKDVPFVKYHLKQGLVLAVIEIALYVIGFTHLFYMMMPIIGIINLGCLILSIIGIVNVVQKKEVALPLVGQFADKIHI